MRCSDSIVPYGVTNTTFLADVYAHLAVHMFREYQSPCYVIEGGSGSCQFGYLLIKRIQDLKQQFGLEKLDIRVVLTDLHEGVLASCQKKECFAELIRQGLADFCVLDADDDPLCLVSRITQRELGMAEDSPVMLIGNYFFDSLRSDIFIKRGQTYYEGLVHTVASKGGHIHPTSVHVSQGHRIALAGAAESPLYYPEPYLNDALHHVLNDVDQDAVITFPTQALRLIHALSRRSKFSLICSDVAETRHYSGRFELSQLTPHRNCFCIPVDFRSLGKALERVLDSAMYQVTSRWNSSLDTLYATTFCPEALLFDALMGGVGPSEMDLINVGRLVNKHESTVT